MIQGPNGVGGGGGTINRSPIDTDSDSSDSGGSGGGGSVTTTSLHGGLVDSGDSTSGDTDSGEENDDENTIEQINQGGNENTKSEEDVSDKKAKSNTDKVRKQQKSANDSVSDTSRTDVNQALENKQSELATTMTGGDGGSPSSTSNDGGGNSSSDSDSDSGGMSRYIHGTNGGQESGGSDDGSNTNYTTMSGPFSGGVGGMTGSEIMAEHGSPGSVVTIDSDADTMQEAASGGNSLSNTFRNLAQTGSDDDDTVSFETGQGTANVEDHESPAELGIGSSINNAAENMANEMTNSGDGGSPLGISQLGLVAIGLAALVGVGVFLL